MTFHSLELYLQPEGKLDMKINRAPEMLLLPDPPMRGSFRFTRLFKPVHVALPSDGDQSTGRLRLVRHIP
jgi:hypothetical protein